MYFYTLPFLLFLYPLLPLPLPIVSMPLHGIWCFPISFLTIEVSVLSFIICLDCSSHFFVLFSANLIVDAFVDPFSFGAGFLAPV
jgi:hypothetical protein